MDNARPLISVIVPVYKVEGYIAACLDSIIAQTYENLEIILVDDGTPDSSGKICDEYAKKDSRIKVIHKENGGVSSARNAGLDIATGELIGFVDSDDTIHPKMYEELYRSLVETGADLVSCSFSRCYTEDDVCPDEISDQAPLLLSAEKALCSMMHRKHFGAHPVCKLYRAQILSGVRFDTAISIAEDVPFVAEAILNSKKIAIIKARLYNYFQRQGSAMNSLFTEKNMTSYDASLKVLELGNRYRVSEETKISLQGAMLLCCVYQAYELVPQKKEAKIYVPIIKKNLRRHISRKALAPLHRSRRVQAILLSISFTLFKLFFRIAKTKNAG